MKLSYKLITRNIVRCSLDTEAGVHHGPHMRYQEARDGRVEWNMSATIARRVTIRTEEGLAVIEWRDNGLVKTDGDLEIEIVKAESEE